MEFVPVLHLRNAKFASPATIWIMLNNNARNVAQVVINALVQHNATNANQDS